MSRLIDADLLEEILDVNIQKLQDEIDDARTYIQKEVYEAQLFSTMEMIRVIKEQPTAFDVENVIDELHKQLSTLYLLKNDCIALNDKEVYAVEKRVYNHAIDVIRKECKAGGIDEASYKQVTSKLNKGVD